MKRILDDVIKKALLSGAASGITERLKNELRDYFAHAAMLAAETEEERTAMIKLFKYVFKDIPAFKGRK